jgi:hypothetical protein
VRCRASGGSSGAGPPSPLLPRLPCIGCATCGRTAPRVGRARLSFQSGRRGVARSSAAADLGPQPQRVECGVDRRQCHVRAEPPAKLHDGCVRVLLDQRREARPVESLSATRGVRGSNAARSVPSLLEPIQPGGAYAVSLRDRPRGLPGVVRRHGGLPQSRGIRWHRNHRVSCPSLASAARGPYERASSIGEIDATVLSDHTARAQRVVHVSWHEPPHARAFPGSSAEST